MANTLISMRHLVMVAAIVLFGYGSIQSVESKPLPLEIGSTFHPADPLFGQQLRKLFTIVKKQGDGKIKLRRSRKTSGASPANIIDLLNAGSIDGFLLDPIRLGYRPAISQVFGGIPFGPGASRIVAWSESVAGREQIEREFEPIGVHPLVCGHSDGVSGVFARKEFAWPAPAHHLTVHTRGFADDVYNHLDISTRSVHGGDLYMAYATGVVDLLVSLNPAMDARTGFAQVSRYFYYPSWERRSAFVLLLMNRKKWQSMPSDTQKLIETACQALNSQPQSGNIAGALAMISKQGAEDTVVKAWPPQFIDAARQVWANSVSKTIARHPSLAPAFKVLDIPNNK